MTDTLDLRPPQRSTRGMIGVPTTLTASLLDADGEPKEAEAVDLYIGGPTSASWPLPDPLGDVTKITGTLDEETGLWMLAVPGLPAGMVLLRLVVDGALVGRLLHHVGSEGSTSPTTELVVRDGAGLVLHLTAIGSGDGSGGGTVDSVARAAITSHTEETTAAHGGIVASTDPRLTDARDPKAHTQAITTITGLEDALGSKANTADLATVAGTGSYADLTDKPSLGSAATADVGDFATAAQGSAITSHTEETTAAHGGIVASTDPRLPPTPVGQSDGRMLAVSGNAWTVVDAPTGGGAALPSIVPVGAYASQPGPYTTGASTLIAEGRATWSALWVPAGTWDAIGVWVTTTTAAVLRVCLDTMSATTGLPATLVEDAGTVDCSTVTGLRLLTFASPVVRTDPGWLWGRVVNTTSTSPTLGLLNASTGCMWPPGIGDGGDFNNRSISGLSGSAQATGSGQAPAPGSFVLSSASTPRVWLRRSA